MKSAISPRFFRVVIFSLFLSLVLFPTQRGVAQVPPSIQNAFPGLFHGGALYSGIPMEFYDGAKADLLDRLDLIPPEFFLTQFKATPDKYELIQVIQNMVVDISGDPPRAQLAGSPLEGQPLMMKYDRDQNKVVVYHPFFDRFQWATLLDMEMVREAQGRMIQTALAHFNIESHLFPGDFDPFGDASRILYASEWEDLECSSQVNRPMFFRGSPGQRMDCFPRRANTALPEKPGIYNRYVRVVRALEQLDRWAGQPFTVSARIYGVPNNPGVESEAEVKFDISPEGSRIHVNIPKEEAFYSLLYRDKTPGGTRGQRTFPPIFNFSAGSASAQFRVNKIGPQINVVAEDYRSGWQYLERIYVPLPE